MIVEILSTGDEIMTGALVDSNSAYIAEQLVSIGLAVSQMNCVGDDRERLVSVLREIGSRADILIMTGGLGPTEDDLTAQVVAQAAGLPIDFHSDADRSIKAFFHSRGRSEKPADQKQAMLPRGAVCIPNPVGTAPGFFCTIGRCVVFCLPGVPSEMKHLLSNSVLPEIAARFRLEDQVFQIRKLSLFGLPESVVGAKLSGFSRYFSSVKLGLRATFPMIQIRLYGSGEPKESVLQQLDHAAEWVMERLGQWIFSDQGLPMEAEVGKLLLQKRATLAVAESCTGGLISHMITNIPGSSSYYLASATTYSNPAKIRLLHVAEEQLRTHGAVSKTVARQMAQGIREITGATYGLSTSGIAGPDGGIDTKPVGTVCIGLSTPEKTYAEQFQLSFGDRGRNKTIFAMAALELLRKELRNRQG